MSQRQKRKVHIITRACVDTQGAVESTVSHGAFNAKLYVTKVYRQSNGGKVAAEQDAHAWCKANGYTLAGDP